MTQILSGMNSVTVVRWVYVSLTTTNTNCMYQTYSQSTKNRPGIITVSPEGFARQIGNHCSILPIRLGPVFVTLEFPTAYQRSVIFDRPPLARSSQVSSPLQCTRSNNLPIRIII